MVSPAQQHNGHATLRFWVQQCPRLCTVVSSAAWMAVRGGGRRCMGFGGPKQQVPSPWGEKQFKRVQWLTVWILPVILLKLGLTELRSRKKGL